MSDWMFRKGAKEREVPEWMHQFGCPTIPDDADDETIMAILSEYEKEMQKMLAASPTKG